MSYPDFEKNYILLRQIEDYARYKYENHCKGIHSYIKELENNLKKFLNNLKKFPIPSEVKKNKPSSLEDIKILRPQGPRRLILSLEEIPDYYDRLEGALLCRFAGCTLGACVEGWSPERMENLAKENNQSFPPKTYWKRVYDLFEDRYFRSIRKEYTLNGMNCVPVDDDIAYTLLGLLIIEEYGPEFTTEDVAKAWIKYLPIACTAEKVALENIKRGISPYRAAEINNPYCEWIGADIRSDPWGYVAPGWPEKAAEFAWRDAMLSHRGEGIYGAMFFSAVISAAFVVDNPVEAIRIGLTEIPANCKLAGAVRWALKTAPSIKNYKQANEAVSKKFKGMHRVHTINNACLTIFGLTIGKLDVTKVLGETVAMGYDNDCTAATAGSIVGAIVGKKNVPKYWYTHFHNKVKSYLNNTNYFKIIDLVKRFANQAEKIFKGSSRL